MDAGEIGAGHQVTALYELTLAEKAAHVATVRVRAKRPGGTISKETKLEVPLAVVDRPFSEAPSDFRFAVAVMGCGELLRRSVYSLPWSYDRALSIAAGSAQDNSVRFA